jgi:multiple sugar transport system substrate-binding protein
MIVVIGLAALASCATSTPTPEPVSISFAFPSSEIVYYSELISTFHEAYPQIHIERKPQRSAADYEQPLQSGRVDTLVFSVPGLVHQFRAEGDLLNLTPFVEQDEGFALSDLNPGAVKACMAEGQLWGIPAGVDLLVMYYNKDLFDRYGVPYPELTWTWDDFVDTILSVRHVDEGIFGCLTDDTLFPSALVYQHGGRLLSDWENPVYTTFDDPLAIDALQWYGNLHARDGAILTDEQAQDLFGLSANAVIHRSRVGLWSGPFSAQGGYGRGPRWAMDWGLAPLPRDSQPATLGFARAYGISAQAEHLEACWEWLKYLSMQAPPQMIPARRSVLESSAYENQVGAETAAVARASMEYALIVSPVQLAFEDALGAFTQAVQDIMDGRFAADEAMIRAQRQSTLK